MKNENKEKAHVRWGIYWPDTTTFAYMYFET